MGYYTYYDLSIYDSNHKNIIDNEIQVITDLRGTYDDARYAFENDGATCESIQWYEIIENMSEFSKLYPDYIFEFTCNGEELLDVYKLYFKNGKHQMGHGHIEYDSYNESLLKEYIILPIKKLSESDILISLGLK